MGTAYEIALKLDLQPELQAPDLETLRYMTRSQAYDFETCLDDPFFTECDPGFDQEWRNIIANSSEPCGEEFFTQISRSVFFDRQLCFRILIDDDTYCNTWWEFSDWLWSISTNEGLVGYCLDVTCMEADLIYFEKHGVTLKFVENCQIPSSLIQSINELLGGTGAIEL